jgi:hypothetical protein
MQRTNNEKYSQRQFEFGGGFFESGALIYIISQFLLCVTSFNNTFAAKAVYCSVWEDERRAQQPNSESHMFSDISIHLCCSFFSMLPAAFLYVYNETNVGCYVMRNLHAINAFGKGWFPLWLFSYDFSFPNSNTHFSIHLHNLHFVRHFQSLSPRLRQR